MRETKSRAVACELTMILIIILSVRLTTRELKRANYRVKTMSYIVNKMCASIDLARSSDPMYLGISPDP